MILLLGLLSFTALAENPVPPEPSAVVANYKNYAALMSEPKAVGLQFNTLCRPLILLCCK